MEDWKRKYLEMFDNHRQMKEKLDELQSYLSDLPTVEESMKNIQEISFNEIYMHCMLLSVFWEFRSGSLKLWKIQVLRVFNVTCSVCLTVPNFDFIYTVSRMSQKLDI